MGYHALLQGVFPTQGSNLYLAGVFFTTNATWEAQSRMGNPQMVGMLSKLRASKKSLCFNDQ